MGPSFWPRSLIEIWYIDWLWTPDIVGELTVLRYRAAGAEPAIAGSDQFRVLIYGARRRDSDAPKLPAFEVSGRVDDPFAVVQRSESTRARQPQARRFPPLPEGWASRGWPAANGTIHHAAACFVWVAAP